MHYFFTKEKIKKLTRDKQYFQKEVTDSSFFLLRMQNPELNERAVLGTLKKRHIAPTEAFIKVLKALPPFITRLGFAEELSMRSEAEIQKILRHIPNTVQELNLEHFPFNRSTLDLQELPPWIKTLIMGSNNHMNIVCRHHFDRSPENYTRNLLACIASIPPSVQFLSLQGQTLALWPSEALLELSNVIPHSVQSLNLLNATLGLCQTSDLVTFFSTLQVSTLYLCDDPVLINMPPHLCRYPQRTVQEMIEIMHALPRMLDTLYAYGSYIWYLRSMESQDVQEILRAIPPKVRTLGISLPEKDRPAALNVLPPSVRHFPMAPNFRSARQICYMRMNNRVFAELPHDEILEHFLQAETVTLFEEIHAPSDEHKRLLKRQFIERVPLLRCSELRIHDFGFFMLSMEECAALVEALHPNVMTLDLSDNPDLGKHPKNLLALIQAIPDTVRTVRLDNIELGSRLSTRELIEFFQEFPKHLHLSLKQNNLFTARSLSEAQDILSAIRLNRPLTVDTLLDSNGGESDAMRVLPILRRVVEKDILLADMAPEILSFLGPDETCLEKPEEQIQSKGCCTIL